MLYGFETVSGPDENTGGGDRGGRMTLVLTLTITITYLQPYWP